VRKPGWVSDLCFLEWVNWCRYIEEVVNSQDNSDQGEDLGPLAEIEFWRGRSVDLSGIRAQLGEPGVAAIVGVLEAAKSTYLAPFENLHHMIQEEAMAAEDNLKFLTALEEPCQKMAKATAKDLAPILPGILHLIRMIWNTSQNYNVPERLTGLLRKVSNEIINRCSAEIKIADILDGNVEASVGTLKDSIAAGEAWKDAYVRTRAAVGKRHAKNPVMRWDFETASIFAHIDAFVQRCKDLLEVCEAQVQFAPKLPLPVFGGSKGPEITKSFVDIQGSFLKLVQGLRGLDYRILDVKATNWHDDYNVFKAGVKDLEVMMQNVIVMAIDAVSSLNSLVGAVQVASSSP
jgi:dynein heavy chain